MLASLASHLFPNTNNDLPPVTPIDMFANWELVIGFLIIVAFTLFYGLRFRWYRTIPSPEHPKGQVNFAGISVFCVFLAQSLLLLHSFLLRIVFPGDFPGRDVFRALVYFTLPASGVFLVVALFMSREQLLRDPSTLQRHLSSPETPVDSEA